MTYRVISVSRPFNSEKLVGSLKDKISGPIAGGISTSIKWAIVRELMARGIHGVTGALEDPNNWEVKTIRKGNTALITVSSRVGYADYINAPFGPYPQKVDRKLLRDWMEFKFGTPPGRNQVTAMQRKIETIGHSWKLGFGYIDNAFHESAMRADYIIDKEIDSAIEETARS